MKYQEYNVDHSREFSSVLIVLTRGQGGGDEYSVIWWIQFYKMPEGSNKICSS